MPPRANDGMKAWAALGLALTLGAALRLWGMTYGLPHPTARPDEELVIGRAFAIFTSGHLDPGNYTYPSLIIYLQALAISLYSAAGRILGSYGELKDFLFAMAVARPGLLYLICRSVSVILGVGTVAATYSLAWAGLRRRDVAFLSALGVATNYLHVRDSRFATVDVGMTFFITLALFFAARAAQEQHRSDYAWSGLFAGLAASAKYNGGLALLGAVGAALADGRDPRRGGARFTRLLIAGGAAFAGFALTSPYVLLRLPSVVAELEARRRYMYDGPGQSALWIHLRETLPDGFGWALALAAGIALVRGVVRRRPFDLVVLAFLVPMLGTMLTTTRVFPRYLIPVVPGLVVLGADLTLSVLPRARIAWLAAALALAGPGLWQSIAFDRLAARRDTRLLASSWVDEHVPARSAIAVCKGYAAPSINGDFRRPPAFRVSLVDCQGDVSTLKDARYLLTVEHPVLRRWSRIPPPLRKRLDSGARALAVFSPFRAGSADSPYFYPDDAFYLPFSGLGAMERGGPIVTVWDLGEGAGS